MTGPAAVPALVDAVDREARRALIEGTDLEGIDFVEVVPGYVPGGRPQRMLLVHLLNGAVADEWHGDRVQVLGGVRVDPAVNPVGVVWAYPALAILDNPGEPTDPLPPGVTQQDACFVNAALPARNAARRRVLVVRTTTSGDWSTYVLALYAADGRSIPPGFDGPLSFAPFGFMVDCPSDLDCRAAETPTPLPSGSPLQDYLARDYEALRGRLVDRLSTLLPRWTDRNPADPAVMLAELFADLGDRLAYWQDAVAVESYLGTARRRTSVRRHGRLLGYTVHEGCSARVWLALRTDVPATLPAGAAVADLPSAAGPLPVDVHTTGGTVFETVTDVDLAPARNEVPLHSWGDPAHALPAGATSAFLAAPVAGGDPGLRLGDVLILADRPAGGPDNPGGGPVEAGDPALRQAVQLDRDPVVLTDVLRPDLAVLEVHWHPDDALARPLVVAEPAPDGGPQTRAVALANVVLADHGASVADEPLDPSQPTPGRPYQPRLPRDGVAFVDPAADLRTPPGTALPSAGALGRPDPRLARAALTLDDGERTWTPQPDLVASSRLDAHVVVEPEPDGGARLRFGDGVNGRSPGTQSTFQARYRVGGGRAGDVAAGQLTHWLSRADGTPTVDGALPAVWNPVPATGGNDPEDAELVRQLAPFAYRQQRRAVTSGDYAAAAESVAGVQRSIDRRRWTGSWYAHEVTVDPLAGRADPTVPVTDLLEIWRMAGVDVEITGPVYVPLLVRLLVCLAPGYLAGDVEAQLGDALSARPLPGGGTGLFHPDRFTFGQPLYVSDVVAAAMAVPGVAWADVTAFARLADPPSATAANLAAGAIRVAAREVLRCDTDPNNPEAGRVEIAIGGTA